MSKQSKKKKTIGRKFEAIHRSRELAVQFLCSLDIRPEQDFSQSLELFLSLDGFVQSDKPEVKERCRNLVLEFWNRRNEIDSLLLRVLTGWRPERMVSVDRTVLRLMILEAFILKTIPIGAAIKEAQNLANDFGTEDSQRFVNGVMFKIIKYFEAENSGSSGQ